jgi:hypothetical protein
MPTVTLNLTHARNPYVPYVNKTAEVYIRPTASGPSTNRVAMLTTTSQVRFPRNSPATVDASGEA